MRVFSVAVLLAASLLPATSQGIAVGEIDEFSAPSGFESWLRGSVQTPGPAGGGDAFLRVDGGRGARVVTFNQDQWAGDYLAAGVTSIALQVQAFGPSPLVLRLAFGDADAPITAGSTWYATSGVSVTPGSGWQEVVFAVDPGSLVLAQGTASASDVLSDVFTLRVLHSIAPSAFGDTESSFGIDRIRAIPEPGTGLLVALGLMALRRATIRR